MKSWICEKPMTLKAVFYNHGLFVDFCQYVWGLCLRARFGLLTWFVGGE